MRKSYMEKKTIELIASGYEWNCPSCEELNHEIEILEIVKCKECGKEFKVQEIYHAYS